MQDAICYEFDNKVAGDGSGVVTIESNAFVDCYTLYWERNGEKLENYSAIVTLSNSEAKKGYRMVNCLAIPKEVTSLAAYEVKDEQETGEKLVFDIPNNKLALCEKPIDTMFWISDIHVVDWKTVEFYNFADALDDIEQIDSKASGIVINGDLVTFATPEEYALFMEAVTPIANDLPPIFYNLGNHDTHSAWNGGEIVGAEKNYAQTTNRPLCYDVMAGHQHLIFLSEVSSLVNITVSKEHLAWLDHLLAEDAACGRQSFLFVHQGVNNTVTGTFEGQWMYGSIENEAKFLDVIERYPSLIMVSGHSHYDLDARVTALNGRGLRPSFVNDGSVAYLTKDLDINDSENDNISGSQGMYVEVYRDCVILRGYDFRNNRYISRAHLRLDLVNSDTKLDSAITIKACEQNSNLLEAVLEDQTADLDLDYTWYCDGVKCGSGKTYLSDNDLHHDISVIAYDVAARKFATTAKKKAL